MKSQSPSSLADAAPEMVEVGLYHLERLAKGGQGGYEPWAKAMYDDLGVKIKPVLPHLYRKLTESPPRQPATLTRTTQRAPWTGATYAVAKRK